MQQISDIASREEIGLFNQAFVARLIHASVAEYEGRRGHGLPISLPFLIVPLALHKPTRESLPLLASASVQKWIRENPRHVAGLAERAVRVRPFTGLALRFALLHDMLANDSGQLTAETLRRKRKGHDGLESQEVAECLKAARFLGRWFARQPDAATLLSFWGLKP